MTLATLATLRGRRWSSPLLGDRTVDLLEQHEEPGRVQLLCVSWPARKVVAGATLGYMPLPLPLPESTPATAEAVRRATTLIAARVQVCGQPISGPKAAWLAQAGWTVDRYVEVGHIVARAEAVHGPAAAARRVPLVESAEETVRCPMPWAEAVPWLQVLAVEPVPYLERTLERRRSEREVFGYVGMIEDLRFAWTGIPAEVAATAYAAGLDPWRVRADLAAGRLDLADVRARAEGRGYRLSPAA